MIQATFDVEPHHWERFKTVCRAHSLRTCQALRLYINLAIDKEHPLPFASSRQERNRKLERSLMPVQGNSIKVHASNVGGFGGVVRGCGWCVRPARWVVWVQKAGSEWVEELYACEEHRFVARLGAATWRERRLDKTKDDPFLPVRMETTSH